MKKSILMVALLLIGTFAMAQPAIVIPQPSPLSKVEQRVGITDISLSYSRPGLKGRKIFGDLVAFNEIWRFGANSPTAIKFSDSVKVGGTTLAAGEYAVYAIPGQTEWTILFGKNPKVAAGDFKQEEAAAKIVVKAEALPMNVETFTFVFANLTTSSADLTMMWEKTQVRIPISVDFDKKVMANINKVLNDVNPYWAAANYYYDNNKDLNQALIWADKYIEKNSYYWTLHLKAKILRKLNKNKEAIAVAEKSLALAKADGDRAYVMNNEKLIAEAKAAK
ncbi:MAG: DUF2911 domain-containing protein [Flexibacteraceae bacterium]